MKIQAELQYFQGEVELVFNKYGNGRTAIVLVDTEDNAPVLVATVNVHEYLDLKEDEVIIKNYSENKGLIPILMINGVIGPALSDIAVGYSTASIHQLLIQP